MSILGSRWGELAQVSINPKIRSCPDRLTCASHRVACPADCAQAVSWTVKVWSGADQLVLRRLLQRSGGGCQRPVRHMSSPTTQVNGTRRERCLAGTKFTTKTFNMQSIHACAAWDLLGGTLLQMLPRSTTGVCAMLPGPCKHQQEVYCGQAVNPLMIWRAPKDMPMLLHGSYVQINTVAIGLGSAGCK